MLLYLSNFNEDLREFAFLVEDLLTSKKVVFLVLLRLIFLFLSIEEYLLLVFNGNSLRTEGQIVVHWELSMLFPASILEFSITFSFFEWLNELVYLNFNARLTVSILY